MCFVMSFFRFYFIFGNRKKKCLKKCGIRETENSVCSADIYVISLVFPFLCVPEVKSIFILAYFMQIEKNRFCRKNRGILVQNAQKIDRKKLKKNMISIKILGLDSGESEKMEEQNQGQHNNKKSGTLCSGFSVARGGFEPSTLRV